MTQADAVSHAMDFITTQLEAADYDSEGSKHLAAVNEKLASVERALRKRMRATRKSKVGN